MQSTSGTSSSFTLPPAELPCFPRLQTIVATQEHVLFNSALAKLASPTSQRERAPPTSTDLPLDINQPIYDERIKNLSIGEASMKLDRTMGLRRIHHIPIQSPNSSALMGHQLLLSNVFQRGSLRCSCTLSVVVYLPNDLDLVPPAALPSQRSSALGAEDQKVLHRTTALNWLFGVWAQKVDLLLDLLDDFNLVATTTLLANKQALSVYCLNEEQSLSIETERLQTVIAALARPAHKSPALLPFSAFGTLESLRLYPQSLLFAMKGKLEQEALQVSSALKHLHRADSTFFSALVGGLFALSFSPLETARQRGGSQSRRLRHLRALCSRTNRWDLLNVIVGDDQLPDDNDADNTAAAGSIPRFNHVIVAQADDHSKKSLADVEACLTIAACLFRPPNVTRHNFHEYLVPNGLPDLNTEDPLGVVRANFIAGDNSAGFKMVSQAQLQMPCWAAPPSTTTTATTIRMGSECCPTRNPLFVAELPSATDLASPLPLSSLPPIARVKCTSEEKLEVRLQRVLKVSVRNPSERRRALIIYPQKRVCEFCVLGATEQSASRSQHLEPYQMTPQKGCGTTQKMNTTTTTQDSQDESVIPRFFQPSKSPQSVTMLFQTGVVASLFARQEIDHMFAHQLSFDVGQSIHLLKDLIQRRARAWWLARKIESGDIPVSSSVRINSAEPLNAAVSIRAESFREPRPLNHQSPRKRELAASAKHADPAALLEVSISPPRRARSPDVSDRVHTLRPKSRLQPNVPASAPMNAVTMRNETERGIDLGDLQLFMFAM